MASEECDILDKASVPIKHWQSLVKGKPAYVPAPYGGNLDNLFTSYQSFEPIERDVWIVGYPKSGNNWIYENICMLLSDVAEPYNRLMVHGFVDFLPNLDQWKSRQPPRVFHTHLPYNSLPDTVKEKSKIIVIMRNPKSTTVSHYHHMKNSQHTQYKGEFKHFWPIYINGITPGYLYGDWFTYNKTYWKAAKLQENITIVFYEDLIHDQLKELRRMSDVLGLTRTKEFYHTVIKHTTKDALINNWSQKHPDDLKFAHKLKPSLIYRNGIIDDWKNHFTVQDNEEFDQIYSEKMADAPDFAANIQFK